MNKMVDACVLMRTRAFTMKLVISFTNYLAAGEVDLFHSRDFYSAVVCTIIITVICSRPDRNK